jgi:hypothetical protein
VLCDFTVALRILQVGPSGAKGEPVTVIGWPILWVNDPVVEHGPMVNKDAGLTSS